MDIIEVGNLVAERRKIIGLKQEDLAEMSGVSTRTIYNIEEGKGNPSFKTLYQLCKILGLDINVAIKTNN